MFDLFIVVLVSCVLLVLVAATFFVIQLVLERFILITLPIITEFYLRMKYPKEFIDDTRD